MDDLGVARRIELLEARLRDVEDRAEIAQLIASYGPAADTSGGEAIRALFAEDATYELEGWFFTHETMADTVTSALHRRYVAAGSAHVMGSPSIDLRGDRAVAVSYSQVLVAEDGRWIVDRCSANRWDLVRGPHGWRVHRRVNRLLDGTEESRDLLAGREPPPAR